MLTKFPFSQYKRLYLTGGVVVIIILLGVLAPALAPKDPLEINTSVILSPPGTPGYPLGTDEFGRDLLSRLLYGARPSLITAGLATMLALFIGVALGLLAGYFRGGVEHITMRTIDVLITFPPILLAMVIVGFFGGGVRNLIIIIGILYIPIFARLTYASTMQVMGMEFILAAQSIGVRNFRIIRTHILPNIISPIIVQTSLTVAAAILLESGLSFLGLGVVPPTPSWGLMIGDAKGYLTLAPYYVIWPSLLIAITILAINSFGDGLRDALDPRLR
jgi:peptide/nickel transport system permease protein